MRPLQLALWFAPALALAGCGEPELVRVGALAPAIDFGACVGDDTRCEQEFPPARLAQPESAPTQCERVEDEGWRPAWWRNTSNVRCAPVGYCAARQVSVSEDGTVWTASLGQSPVVDSDETRFGLLLVHYDQDGETVAQKVVETRELLNSGSMFEEKPIQLAIAADARGHVFVAMVWTEDDAWLGEFDRAARPVGQRVRLEGWQQSMTPGLSVARDGSLLLFTRTTFITRGQSELSAIARLDSGFRPTWLNTRVLPPFGFYALLSGGPSLALVGDADTDPESSGATQVGTLDRTGNLADLLNIPFMGGAPFAVDRSGNLLGLALAIDGPSVATKLTPGGDVLFQVEVAGVQDPKDAKVVHQLRATADPDGNTFFAVHWDDRDEFVNNRDVLTLWQLDADGKRCRVSNIVNALGGAENILELGEIGGLSVANDGDLYVWTQNGIARLTR